MNGQGPRDVRDAGKRNDLAVCVPIGGDLDAFMVCLASVLENVAGEVPVLVPAPEGERLPDALEQDPRVQVSRYAAGRGFAAALNGAAAAVDGDLAVLDASCVVFDGWLERLREAAYSDAGIAVAVAMCNRSHWLSPPATPPAPAVPGRSPSQLAEALAASAAAIRPVTPAAAAHGAYVRREAFELVGRFDERLGDPDAVVADFAARATEQGLQSVLADDVYVWRAAEPTSRGGADERALAERYPWLATAGRSSADPGPWRQAQFLASRALSGLSVTVDARALSADGRGGTQTYVQQLVLALATAPDVRVRAVVAHDIGAEISDAFRAAGVELVDYEQAAAGVERTLVVHRPQQIFSPDDALLLRGLGERILVTHHDLIAYHNPAYHAAVEPWETYRRTTRAALASADLVLFDSASALHDARREQLVATERSDVVPIAVDTADEGPERRPPGVPVEEPYLLVLGADYAHKNRPFAIELLAALRRGHGWPGNLVLAGPHVAHGSSSDREHEILAGDAALAEHVYDIGPVGGEERNWLLRHAAAVAYPSTCEGFGLIPFEAARAGVPCLYAPIGALAETAGPRAATIVPWVPVASAQGVIGLLQDSAARVEHLSVLADAARRFTTAGMVSQLLHAYDRALRLPYSPLAARAVADLERERLLAEHGAERDRQAQLVATVMRQAGEELLRQREEMTQAFHARAGRGLALVQQPGGLLSPTEQRGLMRVAARRWPHRLLLWPLSALGSIGARVRDGAES